VTVVGRSIVLWKAPRSYQHLIMVKAPPHGRKQPPPAPLIVQGRTVSVTSVRSGGSGQTTTTTLTSSSASNAEGIIRGANNTSNKKPGATAGNRPRPPSQHQQAQRHPSSTLRQSASGRGRPRPNRNGVSSRASRSNGTNKSSSAGSSDVRPPTQTRQQQPQRKAPPTHLLTNARTSVPVSETAQRQQQRQPNQKRRNQPSVNENESNTNNDGFEALTWNPFQGEDGATNQNYWSGGSTQAGLASSVNSVGNNQSRQFSMATMPTISSTSDSSSVVSSAYSVEGGVHMPGGGGSNKSKLLGGSIRSTGKTTRKLAGKLGSKLTSVGAKARGLAQMGDDAFYGAGEAGFSTNIRTITEEEASGAAAAISSSLASSTESNGATTIVSVTQRGPPANNSASRQRPSPQSLDSDGQTAANRGLIPTAFARLASVQTLSAPGAVATAQAIPVAGSTPTATVVSATSVVATTTTLRPPAPVVVGGKVVVKGVAINRTFTGDLKKIEATVQKYKRIRASAGSRHGSRAALQSNSELAASIAELRACLPKLEALVNRAMLSRTTDANTLERLLSLNDELRLILANLKGEGIKRRINGRDGSITARSSQLPTAQQARDQHLFQKMRDDSNEITAPVVAARAANGAPANQEPLFHDDPFHGFPEFNNFDDDFETIPEDGSVNDAKPPNVLGTRSVRREPKADDDESNETESDTSSISMLAVVTDDDESSSLCSDSQDEAKSVRVAAKGSDEVDRNGLSHLEDEVARLEKQLSGLDPLAQLAMDTILDEEMSHMSNLSITSDGDASADAGFADMEREMMEQLALGNAWTASETVDDTPKVSRVKFSQDVTVFEIPNRHQAREAER